MDIIVSGKYSVLSYRHMKDLVPFCQRSVWDHGSDIENVYASEDKKEEEKEYYDSNQAMTMFLADA